MEARLLMSKSGNSGHSAPSFILADRLLSLCLDARNRCR